LSHLTLRLPALIGAGLYVAASVALCRRISDQRAIQWPLFVCLVYSPFVMDYMVAARGYGLALGCMLAAIWALWGSRFGLASLCAGMSFCANFSFAYVDASLMLAAAVLGWRETRKMAGAPRGAPPG
jgi:hypothetical protein